MLLVVKLANSLSTSILTISVLVRFRSRYLPLFTCYFFKMATAQTLTIVDIPGLHRSPGADDFADSRNVYALLPRSPPIFVLSLTPRAAPMAYHSLRSSRRYLTPRSRTWANFLLAMMPMIRSVSISCMLIFRSLKGMSCMVLESSFSGNSESCWTKPVPVRELAAKPIHGHVFQVQRNGTFVPYEFQEGEAPTKAAKVPKAFFHEFSEFLHLNNLASLIALQLLDGPRDRTETELLVGPQSTLIMDTKDIIGFEPAQITTGWSFQVGDDGIISCKGNDVYAEKKHTHGVFQDSKPLPTLEALKAALLQEGIIA